MGATLENRKRANRIRHLLELGYTAPGEACENTAPELDPEPKGEAVRAVKRTAEAGRIDEARQSAVALAERWPKDWQIRALAANYCHAAGKNREALEHLDTLMYSGVETPSVVLLRGVVLLACRQTTEAIKQLEYARGLDPARQGAWGRLAEAYYRVGRTHEADAAFREELTRHSSPHAHQGLAAALCRQGEYDEALEHALSAVELAPAQWSTHWWLGVVLAGCDRVVESTVAFENAAHLNPKRASPYRWLTRLHREDAERAQEYRRLGRERAKQRVIARRDSGARTDRSRPSEP